MRLRSSLRSLGVLLIALLPAAGCGGSPTESDGMLPMEFMVRSDVPYIRGLIVERSTLPAGMIRIRVRVLPGVEARTPEAIVTVLPDAVIRWANGDHGTMDQLRRGQMVTVWTTGPELRSSPPQVSANGIILHRSMWR